MLIPHKGHTDTIQVYSVAVMTHVKALQAGHSSQGTSEPITPVLKYFVLYSAGTKIIIYITADMINISVTIGQCCLVVWVTVVGIDISYVMVHSRWIEVA